MGPSLGGGIGLVSSCDKTEIGSVGAHAVRFVSGVRGSWLCKRRRLRSRVEEGRGLKSLGRLEIQPWGAYRLWICSDIMVFSF